MTAPAKAQHFWSLPDDHPSAIRLEKRRLADVLRSLIALCVTTDAPDEELIGAIDDARAIVDRLEKWPRRTFEDAYASIHSPADAAAFADRGTLVGRANPIAPPLSLTNEGELSIATCTFGPAYEGAPGCVHGGLLAAAFDQLFGFIQVSRHVGSLTASLTVKYRKPTPIDVPLRLEGKLERVEGRKSWVSARMLAHGEVTAEAEGLFVALQQGQMNAIVERHTRATEGH